MPTGGVTYGTGSVLQQLAPTAAIMSQTLTITTLCVASVASVTIVVADTTVLPITKADLAQGHPVPGAEIR